MSFDRFAGLSCWCCKWRRAQTRGLEKSGYFWATFGRLLGWNNHADVADSCVCCCELWSVYDGSV